MLAHAAHAHLKLIDDEIPNKSAQHNIKVFNLIFLKSLVSWSHRLFKISVNFSTVFLFLSLLGLQMRLTLFILTVRPLVGLDVYQMLTLMLTILLTMLLRVLLTIFLTMLSTMLFAMLLTMLFAMLLMLVVIPTLIHFLVFRLC